MQINLVHDSLVQLPELPSEGSISYDTLIL